MLNEVVHPGLRAVVSIQVCCRANNQRNPGARLWQLRDSNAGLWVHMLRYWVPRKKIKGHTVVETLFSSTTDHRAFRYIRNARKDAESFFVSIVEVRRGWHRRLLAAIMLGALNTIRSHEVKSKSMQHLFSPP